MKETFTVWEAECVDCGKTTLTDKHTGGEPYFGVGCVHCPSVTLGPWRVWDEPHPALWVR